MKKFILAVILLFIAITLYIYSLYKMPETSFKSALPLLSHEQMFIRDLLIEHVDFLSHTIGERNVYNSDSLERSAKYISKYLSACNSSPYYQNYSIDNKVVSNVIGVIKPISESRGVIVIGAHYDSVLGSSGANDNATGVAAMLVLCHMLSGEKLNHTVKFVGFVNEEPPFFKTERMGSYVFAKNEKEQGVNIKGMLSLETIGAYYQQAHTQHYPALLEKLYPNKGNFLAFVSNPTSSWLLKALIKNFRQTTPFPSEGLTAPDSITGIDWSDHWAFGKFGYPAVMLTDTALFRYPYYHTNEDTKDKIDFDSLSRVVFGLKDTLIKLDKEI